MGGLRIFALYNNAAKVGQVAIMMVVAANHEDAISESMSSQTFLRPGEWPTDGEELSIRVIAMAVTGLEVGVIGYLRKPDLQ